MTETESKQAFVKVFLPECDGGFLTLVCSSDVSVKECKRQVLDLLAKKRTAVASTLVSRSLALAHLREAEEEYIILSEEQSLMAICPPDEKDNTIKLALIATCLEPQRPRASIIVSAIVTAQGKFISSTTNGLKGTQHGFKVNTVEQLSDATSWEIITDGRGWLLIKCAEGRFLSCSPQGLVYTTEESECSRWVVEEGSYLVSVYKSYLTSNAVDGRVYCDGGKGAWGKWDMYAELIENSLKKKASSSRPGRKWQKRYFRLSKHVLCYWTSKSKSGEEPRKQWSTVGITGVVLDPSNPRRFMLSFSAASNIG